MTKNKQKRDEVKLFVKNIKGIVCNNKINTKK